MDKRYCNDEAKALGLNVNVNLILYKKWKIILYNFQLFAGWFSRNARLSFSLYDGPLIETTDE